MAEYIVNDGETSTGIVLEYDSLVVLSGGVIINTEIKNSGYVDVSSGGTANSTTVNENGILWINSGGTMNSAAVNSGGYVGISSGGKAKNVVENGGYVYIVDELENGHPNVKFKKNSFSGVVLTGDGTGKKKKCFCPFRDNGGGHHGQFRRTSRSPRRHRGRQHGQFRRQYVCLIRHGGQYRRQFRRISRH